MQCFRWRQSCMWRYPSLDCSRSPVHNSAFVCRRQIRIHPRYRLDRCGHKLSRWRFPSGECVSRRSAAARYCHRIYQLQLIVYGGAVACHQIDFVSLVLIEAPKMRDVPNGAAMVSAVAIVLPVPLYRSSRRCFKFVSRHFDARFCCVPRLAIADFDIGGQFCITQNGVHDHIGGVHRHSLSACRPVSMMAKCSRFYPPAAPIRSLAASSVKSVPAAYEGANRYVVGNFRRRHHVVHQHCINVNDRCPALSVAVQWSILRRLMAGYLPIICNLHYAGRLCRRLAAMP